MDILDETNEFIERREGQRPVFLKVLCILTWVGCGVGLFGGLIQLWSYSAINAVADAFDKTNQTTYFGALFWQSIATFASAIICAIAAVLMWRLKKIGFFIYIFGEILPSIASLYMFLSISNEAGIGQEFAFIGTAFSFVFPIAFIIMYGVNLKHMK